MQDTQRASLSIKRPLLLCALAAACALPLLPVQAGEGIHVSRSLQASDGGAPYAVVRGKDDVVAGERADSARIKELRRSIKGDFLWFRDGGKEYVVQDPATMGRVLAAWAPLEAIGARMGGQGAEMGRHGAAMGAVGAKMALAAITFDGDKMEALGKEMEEAGKPMEAAGKKMEELGKEMEREQDKAERAMRLEIRDALSKGTARALPLRS